MGRTAHELIPAAILLDNPGVTREEFAEHMHSTRNYTKVTMGNPMFERNYHAGLYGVADVLTLPERKEYIAFMKNQSFSDGVRLGSPTLDIEIHIRKDRSNVRKNPLYDVTINTKNELQKEGELERGFYEKASEGEIVEDHYHKEHLITKILDYTNVDISQVEPQDPTDGPHRYKFKTREIIRTYEEHRFKSIDAMLTQFPFFNPDFQYDFSKDSGKITTGNYWSEFYWKKKDSRYYLDEKTFDRIPAALKGLRIEKMKHEVDVYGYTDLILTAEAIKNRWWSCLSYVYDIGVLPKRMARMFWKHPESHERYERAVWDSHSSLFARAEGMTHSELLHWRLIDCKVR